MSWAGIGGWQDALIAGFLPSRPGAAIIAEIKAEARADRLTDQNIDEELAAYNAERRF